MLNIKLAELIGNTFAFYLYKTGNRVLTVDQLKTFSLAIIDELDNDDIPACISDSFDKIPQFIDEYQNWFSAIDNNSSIVLHEDVSVDDLLNTFAVYMTPNAICAFGNNDNLELLSL